MKRITVMSAMLSALLGACASSSDKIAATYVSPIQYANLTCPQIAAEAARVSTRAAEAAGVQDQKRRNDQVATAVGAVVFWPALFFIDGDNQHTTELARLKGEMQALEQASAQRNCGIRFQQQTAR